MRYKGEIMSEGKVAKKNVFTLATHPQQIINKMIYGMVASQFSMYIANDNGDVWLYDIVRVGNRFHATPRFKKIGVLNTNQRHDIFSDNMSIKEALQ